MKSVLVRLSGAYYQLGLNGSSVKKGFPKLGENQLYLVAGTDLGHGRGTYSFPVKENSNPGGKPYSFIVEKYEKNPAAVAI